MMIANGPAAEDVVIRCEISLLGLPELEADVAGSEDGTMLNHSYFDVRGCSLEVRSKPWQKRTICELLAELAAIG